MNIVQDIQTLSEFKQNASKLVKQVQKTRRPIVLTVNGKPAVVLQDPETYQNMVNTHDYDETVRELRKRLADIDDPDKWLSHDEVFSRIRAKYHIDADDA